MSKKLWTIKRAKHEGWRDHCQMVVVGVAEIVQGLVTLLTLGFFHIELTAWLLFDVFVEWEDDDLEYIGVEATAEFFDEMERRHGEHEFICNGCDCPRPDSESGTPCPQCGINDEEPVWRKGGHYE
jgi:hypothetical protein